MDLASLPPDSGLADQGILIAGNPPQQNGVVSVVENDVNNAQTINPPPPPDSVVSGQAGFTSSVEFFAALGSSPASTQIMGGEPWWVEGYETFALGTLIPDGSTANGVTYRFPGGLDGLVDNEFNSFETRGLQISRRPGLNFFFAGESVTVDFEEPCFAVGVFINANLEVNSSDDLFLQTPVGTVRTGGLVYDIPFFPPPLFPTFFFLGIISDVPFTTATFGSAELLSYTLDNLVCAPTQP